MLLVQVDNSNASAAIAIPVQTGDVSAYSKTYQRASAAYNPSVMLGGVYLTDIVTYTVNETGTVLRVDFPYNRARPVTPVGTYSINSFPLASGSSPSGIAAI